jgi:hypothetical protein
MRLLFWGIGAVCLCSWLAGCQNTPSGPPSDPIFVSKKPIISRPDLKPPGVSAHLEPEMPAGPVQAVASPARQGPGGGTEDYATRVTVRGQAP